jgi:hypothetical protein
MRFLPYVLMVSCGGAAAFVGEACSSDSAPSCGATYRYGVTGIRITLKRR